MYHNTRVFFVTNHCKGLASARSAVSEARAIVAAKKVVEQRTRRVLKDPLGGRILIKNSNAIINL